jgi:N-acetylmuramoyl-L-alanine amidase
MSLPVTHHPSPNFDARQTPISHIILHYTDMPDCAAALARLCEPAAKVSAHYLIRRDGHIFQLVDEAQRAWHAGFSFWRGAADMNSASIGIELDYDGPNAAGQMPPYPKAQMQALIALLGEIVPRHGLNPHNILGHSDIAPARKIDPGEAFDWAALAQVGFGLWLPDVKIEDVPPLGAGSSEDKGEDKAVAPLQKALAAIGYQLEASGTYDAQTETVVAAFQRHFRPANINGIADAETQSLIYAVCRGYKT